MVAHALCCCPLLPRIYPASKLQVVNLWCVVDCNLRNSIHPTFQHFRHFWRPAPILYSLTLPRRQGWQGFLCRIYLCFALKPPILYNSTHPIMCVLQADRRPKPHVFSLSTLTLLTRLYNVLTPFFSSSSLPFASDEDESRDVASNLLSSSAMFSNGPFDKHHRS